MTVLVVAEAAAILLLGLLVAGLLRSHAEILRRLHALGVDLDPATEASVEPASAPRRRADVVSELEFPGVRDGVAPPRQLADGDVRAPGPDHVVDIAGMSPFDEAIAIGVAAAEGRTLLAFLSSGCASCAGFWQQLVEPGGVPLPDGTRLVVVTKGPDDESESALARLAPRDVPVVMSSHAWSEYAVPGSPYFLLVDAGQVVGEGSGGSWDQVLNLLGQAVDDTARRRRRGSGARREERADRELMAAGIHPGHASLYPTAEES